MMNPIIQFEDVTFAYTDGNRGSFRILNQLNIAINQGELVAVVGANGSGKTTLLRHINGLLIPQTGRVLIDGSDTRRSADLRDIRQKVGMVFQHPEDQIVASTVAEDVAFGPENLGLASQEIQKRVAEALAIVELTLYAERPPHMLSGGQMQRLALAGVLALHPKIVLFDEATSMLDPAGRQMAIRWMQRLHSEGITVLFITHHMEEAALASRMIVLHNGKIVLDGTPREVFTQKASLRTYGLGLPRPARYADRFSPWLGKQEPFPILADEWIAHLPVPPMGCPTVEVRDYPAAQHTDKIIEVSDLDYVYLKNTPFAHQALNAVNLNAYQGLTLGLLGQTGSGKSTLLQHLNGILRPQRGCVRAAQFNLHDPATRTSDVVKHVGLVFQNPEVQFFEQYVGDEIAFGARQIGTDEPLAERVRWAMGVVGLDFELFKDRLLFSLSGGEKRKVALAAALALKPRILLLDEPTAGLDPVSHLDILGKLAGLQSEGMTIVISSHRMNDLAALTNHLAVFMKGCVIRQGLTGEVFWDCASLAEAGLEPPLIVRTAIRLRELGWQIPEGIVTPDQLEAALRACCSKGTKVRDEPI